jgi:hypothetical protein
MFRDYGCSTCVLPIHCTSTVHPLLAWPFSSLSLLRKLRVAPAVVLFEKSLCPRVGKSVSECGKRDLGVRETKNGREISKQRKAGTC